MSTFLILGGTGKTGRRLSQILADAGHHVRPASRRPEAGGVRFDWDDPATYDPALAGADGAYLVPPALRLDHPPLVAAFAARASALGVGRVVALSARGGNLDPSSPLARMEAAIAGSGVEHSFIRPTWFMQNFTESFFVPGITGQGVVAAPTGDGAEPFVDVADIAAVAAEALTGEGHAGRAYDLSGPRALTFAEAAAILSPHVGREVSHVDPGLDAWKAGAAKSGVPPEYADVLGTLFGLIAGGQDAALSDGVQRALGREPTSFEDWAAREAGALAVAAAA